VTHSIGTRFVEAVAAQEGELAACARPFAAGEDDLSGLHAAFLEQKLLDRVPQTVGPVEQHGVRFC
jgi:hypothetical protein